MIKKVKLVFDKPESCSACPLFSYDVEEQWEYDYEDSLEYWGSKLTPMCGAIGELHDVYYELNEENNEYYEFNEETMVHRDCPLEDDDE